jgi:hypothetical protein
MIKRILRTLVAALPFVALVAHADEPYPWGGQEQPSRFLFGNEIDTHLNVRQARDGSLYGFFYVAFTGVVTHDGLRVATHVDCTISSRCSAGWRVAGKPAPATLLYQPMQDHPVFVVKRQDMPQPGSYSHFHWLGQAMPQVNNPVDGYLLQLTAMNRFCFIHHEAGMATIAATCRGNGGVPVQPGVDIATHLNIVAAPPMGM